MWVRFEEIKKGELFTLTSDHLDREVYEKINKLQAKDKEGDKINIMSFEPVYIDI